jgi:hypothetical protein
MSADLRTALARMRRSCEELLRLLDGVTDVQWRRRPQGEEWSLAETVEHVFLAAQGIGRRLGTQLLAAPLDAATTRFDDARIDADMFRIDGPAPALAVPTGRFATRAEGVAALAGACDAIVGWAERSGANLRQFGLPHPVFGVFDGVQWILFLAAHADNHAPQVRALLAHPELAPAS